jgi:hypothetical protein
MLKCCNLCRFSYYADESDVRGFSCEQYNFLFVTEPNKHHCKGFKFSWLKFLFGRIK